jgi:hypothetical protein
MAHAFQAVCVSLLFHLNRCLGMWLCFDAGIDLATYSYPCPKCDDVLVGIDAFKQHQIRHFQKLIVPCPHCHLKYPSMTLLNRHLPSHRDLLAVAKAAGGDSDDSGEDIDSESEEDIPTKRPRSDGTTASVTAFV